MQWRRFEINLISASNLEDVREVFRMKVYAKVKIGGNKRTKKKTPIDKQNETNPAWNCTLEYAVEEKAVLQEGVMLAVKLYCSRTFGDRYVGEVLVSLKELYDKAAENGGSAVFDYKVMKGSAEGQGELKFSCSFGENVVIQQPSKWKKVLTTGVMVLVDTTASALLDEVVEGVVD